MAAMVETIRLQRGQASRYPHYTAVSPTTGPGEISPSADTGCWHGIRHCDHLIYNSLDKMRKFLNLQAGWIYFGHIEEDKWEVLLFGNKISDNIQHYFNAY